jgi:hypothetical protein
MREFSHPTLAVLVLALIALPLTGCYDGDGVVQPDSYYMRYRASEYSSYYPFFQWYYYTIKDLTNDRYFAFDLSQTFGPQDDTNEGTYVMFSMVEQAADTAFHKYERWDISDWNVSGDFHITIPGSNYEIEPINNDTYHLTGSMTAPGKVWFADGKLDGLAIDPAMVVEWDLMIYRTYGWYGQQDVESDIKANGIISWNTYAHTSEVEGTITVDGTVYTFSRTPQYRAYCDMNWGENFPSGSPKIDYMWGWYYAGVPSSNPNEEIGMIAGIGRHDVGGIYGICEGSFADFRLPNGERLSVREMQGLKPNPEDDGVAALSAAEPNDSLQSWDVARSDWATLTDSLGSDLIPLRQIVTIQTQKKLVTMDFQSTLADYNRLLFPHQDYVFSDFEGLGVTAHVTVVNRQTSQTIVDFTTNDAGLEYGYDTD